jgi:hypothetical protein
VPSSSCFVQIVLYGDHSHESRGANYPSIVIQAARAHALRYVRSGSKDNNELEEEDSWMVRWAASCLQRIPRQMLDVTGCREHSNVYVSVSPIAVVGRHRVECSNLSRINYHHRVKCAVHELRCMVVCFCFTLFKPVLKDTVTQFSPSLMPVA